MKGRGTAREGGLDKTYINKIIMMSTLELNLKLSAKSRRQLAVFMFSVFCPHKLTNLAYKYDV